MDDICKSSTANAGFAFAVICDLILVTDIVLAVLHVFNMGIRRHLLGNILLFSSIPLFVFSCVALGAPGAACISFSSEEVPVCGSSRVLAHASYAFSTGVRCILLATFLGITALVEKFARNGTFLFKPRHTAAPPAAPPVAAPPTTLQPDTPPNAAPPSPTYQPHPGTSQAYPVQYAAPPVPASAPYAAPPSPVCEPPPGTAKAAPAPASPAYQPPLGTAQTVTVQYTAPPMLDPPVTPVSTVPVSPAPPPPPAE